MSLYGRVRQAKVLSASEIPSEHCFLPHKNAKTCRDNHEHARSAFLTIGIYTTKPVAFVIVNDIKLPQQIPVGRYNFE